MNTFKAAAGSAAVERETNDHGQQEKAPPEEAIG